MLTNPLWEGFSLTLPRLPLSLSLLGNTKPKQRKNTFIDTTVSNRDGSTSVQACTTSDGCWSGTLPQSSSLDQSSRGLPLRFFITR
mmetsp:Transcript_50901/g.99804  ORF Transcript_50901/g.99804 Transcript_50901/m.99804 type:complete len:86 (-) Transcript_50901:495-752(-)